MSICFHSTKVDDSLYSTWDSSKFVQIHMHVADSLMVSNSKWLLTLTRTALSGLHNLKWNAKPTEHWGIKIHQNHSKGIVHLSHEVYLQHVLDSFGMENSNSVVTPLYHLTHLASASQDNINANSNSYIVKLWFVWTTLLSTFLQKAFIISITRLNFLLAMVTFMSPRQTSPMICEGNSGPGSSIMKY